MRFVDVTAKSGIHFVHDWGATPDKRILETLGSGVAWIDYDNDGFQDLFFVNAAPGAANALYRNNRDGTLTDVTQQAGVAVVTDKTSHIYKTGVAVGDYDNDDYLDLYVTAFGPSILYRNNRNGTFTDVTAAAGVAGGLSDWSTSTGFFDFDRDGDLDLYVTNYLTYRIDDDPYCGLRKPGYRTYCGPTLFDGAADRLYRNNGNGTFTDVSRAAGIANSAGKGLGVTFCDFDRDGNVDIYVANDQVRNFLYRNNGDGTFKDVAYGAGVGFSSEGKPQGGMGTDCADFNGDGLPDIFVTNFENELNALYKNHGDGTFQDVSASTGMRSSYGPVGFGTRLFDMDNDGDLDIIVTNGHVIDNVQLYRPASTFAQRNALFENLGGRFLDVSDRSGPAFQIKRVGRGLAVADFDNDGDLDVVISNQGQAPVLHFSVLQKRFTAQLGRDLIFLTITFDPARDQPDVLARYAIQWKPDPKAWHFLTGSVLDVGRVLDMFDVSAFPVEGLMDHSLHTVLIDRNGTLVANIEGNQFSSDQLGDLTQAVLNTRPAARGK